ncbi:S1C family serine protease, partial [Myxococcota bacterium]|nr:S1C family serine protease [Myxococcota bacterium]
MLGKVPSPSGFGGHRAGPNRWPGGNVNRQRTTRPQQLRGSGPFTVVLALLAALMAPGGGARAEDPFLRRTATVRVVESAGPAVVNITTEQIAQEQSPFRKSPSSSPSERYFNELFVPRTSRTLENLGSGVIISPQGHVLTNEHVVARATRISVTLADGRAFDARVVGADPTNDLAVLQIETESPLPWLTPGSSRDVMVGEPVIAIGNPFGLSHTVTTGVLSATNRSVKAHGH